MYPDLKLGLQDCPAPVKHENRRPKIQKNFAPAATCVCLKR
ncbi:hypothetical protein AYI70_g12231, partial [Smittium culicis]